MSRFEIDHSNRHQHRKYLAFSCSPVPLALPFLTVGNSVTGHHMDFDLNSAGADDCSWEAKRSVCNFNSETSSCLRAHTLLH
eukprot:IDg20519t1